MHEHSDASAIPVVILAADVGAGVSVARSFPHYEFRLKPVDPEHLVNVIRDLLAHGVTPAGTNSSISVSDNSQQTEERSSHHARAKSPQRREYRVAPM
jgi:hypothetical protein